MRTHRVLIAAHVLCSLCAGVAGLFLASRLGAARPWVGTDGGYDLESIAAVVLGGTAAGRGRGGVAGTVGGVLLLAVLDSIFNQLEVDPFFKDVVRGVVIIARSPSTPGVVDRRSPASATEAGRAMTDRHAPAPTARRRRPGGDPASTAPAAASPAGRQARRRRLDRLPGARRAAGVPSRSATPTSSTRRRCWPSLKRAAPLVILAAGQYFVIVAGEFDLSVGSLVTAEVVIAARLIDGDPRPHLAGARCCCSASALWSAWSTG